MKINYIWKKNRLGTGLIYANCPMLNEWPHMRNAGFFPCDVLNDSSFEHDLRF